MNLRALSAYLDALIEQLYRDGVFERDYGGPGQPEPHAARLEAVARWLRKLADDRPGKDAGPSPDLRGAGFPPPSHQAGSPAITCGWCGYRMTEPYARCASCGSELCDLCAEGWYCPECADRVAYETEMEARYQQRKDMR